MRFRAGRRFASKGGSWHDSFRSGGKMQEESMVDPVVWGFEVWCGFGEGWRGNILPKDEKGLDNPERGTYIIWIALDYRLLR